MVAVVDVERERPVVVTLVCDRLEIGGAEQMLLNILRHLDPQRFRCRVICFKRPGALGAEFEAAGIPLEVLGRGGRHDLRTLPRLISRLRRTGTDVVLVHHMHPAPLTLGRIAARLLGRAGVVVPHGMDMLRHTGNRVLPRHDVETLALSSAIVWLAASQREYFHREEHVGRHWGSRTREVVIPNGIPVGPRPTAADRVAARRTLGLADDVVAVGIVARLAAVKAHEVLLGAVAELVPTHPQLRLVCIGGGEREDELRALARSTGVDGHVQFTGLRRDVPDLLPGLDIAALSSRYECAPLGVIEGMAAGLPVVSADVGAVRDMVADGVEGYVVPPGDVGAFADRIGRLVDDPALRARLGAQARDRAEREFRIEDTAAAFERLFTSLARGEHDSPRASEVSR